METKKMTTTFAELEPNVEPLGPASGYLKEFIEAVRPKAPFESFTIEETTLLSQYMECFGVSRNATVLHEGDDSDSMAILLTGKAVILQAHQGRQHVVFQLRPGDMLGETSLIGGETRFASCVTAEPSKCWITDPAWATSSCSCCGA
jgi:CRP/FNR family cyclic AMP-dependent transcriptional regulator